MKSESFPWAEPGLDIARTASAREGFRGLKRLITMAVLREFRESRTEQRALVLDHVAQYRYSTTEAWRANT